MNTADEIIYEITADQEVIRQLIDRGYFPVYNHPSASGFMSAQSAYSNSFGICQNNPRFVIVGTEVNAHTCFVIASLLGLLPHASRSKEGLEHVTRNLSALSMLISKYHKGPKGVDLEKTEEGSLLLFWLDLYKRLEDTTMLRIQGGVTLWYGLTTSDDYLHLRKKKNVRERLLSLLWGSFIPCAPKK